MFRYQNLLYEKPRRDHRLRFKTTPTESVVLIGAPAKRLIGSGNEADEGDAGNAELVFYPVPSVGYL
jgi:hypothetical protein